MLGSERFELLREEYQKSFPEKEALLRSLQEELKKTGSIQTLKSLRLEVHKLAGSAAMFGFTKIGSLCKIQEGVLGGRIDALAQERKEFLSLEDTREKELFSQLEFFMECIRRELRNERTS